MNTDIEHYIKHHSTCYNFQPKEQVIHQDIPDKPWEVVGVDMFTLNNKNYICIVDYDSKFQIVKNAEDMSAGCLIL